MKYISKYLSIICAIIIVLLTFNSCGTKEKIDSVNKNEIGFYDTEYDYSTDVTEENIPSKTESMDNSVEQNRKLIKTAFITLESKKFDETISIINKQTKTFEGYIAESKTEGSNERHADITVKVPAKSLDEFLNVTTEAATIIEQEISINDITSNYVDTESHIAALKAEQSALLAILKKAENIDSTLQIYNQLSEVNYQLENYERQLKAYDNSVEYATISISVNEVERETPQDGSFLNKIKTQLINNLNNIKIFNLLLFFSMASPSRVRQLMVT